ncbi:hypothetical protein [Streptosporangium carneum]|uniref:Uncharacterized protein n=1 Tax=Streptosporangium carneum TaxID=47481 RepID=A0A9W6I7T6_9ACTN|nr:hypothetical protein [Streptosporangium carneum]GLK13312.1 hypothetical protein GCM10017600_67230 [Streptosporangium carneum]
MGADHPVVGADRPVVGADRPETETDHPFLTLSGKPSDEEIAATVVAFLLVRRNTRDTARPRVRKPFWIAGPAYRGPLQRG